MVNRAIVIKFVGTLKLITLDKLSHLKPNNPAINIHLYRSVQAIIYRLKDGGREHIVGKREWTELMKTIVELENSCEPKGDMRPLDNTIEFINILREILGLSPYVLIDQESLDRIRSTYLKEDDKDNEQSDKELHARSANTR